MPCLQLCDMETTLTIERARAEEAEKAAAKAERRMQQAVREARWGLLVYSLCAGYGVQIRIRLL